MSQRQAKMLVSIGEEGLDNSWQESFPPTTQCVHCRGEARVAFVASEGLIDGCNDRKRKSFVHDLHDNAPDKAWVHDAIAVAVYLCSSCLMATAICNQA